MCKKASQKLNTLTRISNYMDVHKRQTVIKSLINLQFSYSSKIWMFHDISLNNKINSIHERALKITYTDKISTFHLNGIVLFQYTIEICRYWRL